jgi:hypothetical protein
MVKIKLSDLKEVSKNRPEKYYEDVVSHGVISKDILELSQEKYDMLVKKYSKQENKVIHFANSMATWVGSGFKKVQQHVYERRLAICRKCQFWQENGNMGMGKCLKCGCGKGKHWLPHEQCPIGLWGKENT